MDSVCQILVSRRSHLASVSGSTASSTTGGSSRGLRMPSFSSTIHIGFGMNRADNE